MENGAQILGGQITELRRQVREQILLLRSVWHLINQDTFTQLWDSSNPDEQDKVKYYALMGDRGKLKNWVTHHPSIELGEKSVRDLKDLAKVLGVQNYSRMTKPELISAIEKTV